jgi:mono/diheme cytochrome c family protein
MAVTPQVEKPGRTSLGSKLVAEDQRGDKIEPLVRGGRPEQGMPAFSLGDADLAAIVAFIHDQKTKAEALGGGRRGLGNRRCRGRTPLF